MSDNPILSVRNLTKTYEGATGGTPVLYGINLDLWPGEMLAIIGPSGCGKSTLLFILGLLAHPSSGTYVADGVDVLTMSRGLEAEYRRKHVGFVLQSCNLVENTTVYENLEFPLIYAGIKRSRRKRLIQQALENVDLAHRIHYRTNQLSGGEQQRVALSRAMVNSPRVILADEPTGQLDRANGERVMDYFKRLASTSETATIVVTHDMAVAGRCSRICRLEDGILSDA